jgi:hypothetical protein
MDNYEPCPYGWGYSQNADGKWVLNETTTE